mmetsp:Transcript_8040/g.22827  ORF Transcript_8040/g.22827 Transcript_8040/m.22827 type:complete len:304 (-) Transcript_8040:861-1772(-)
MTCFLHHGSTFCNPLLACVPALGLGAIPVVCECEALTGRRCARLHFQNIVSRMKADRLPFLTHGSGCWVPAGSTEGCSWPVDQCAHNAGPWRAGPCWCRSYGRGAAIARVLEGAPGEHAIDGLLCLHLTLPCHSKIHTTVHVQCRGIPRRRTVIVCVNTCEGPSIRNLEAGLEKDCRRVVEESGPARVVVSSYFDKVLVAGVFIVDLLRMVRRNEVVIFTRHEECGDEAAVGVRSGGQVPDVEPRLLLHGTTNHPNSDADDETWYGEPLLPAFVDHLLGKLIQVCKGAVKNHSSNRRVSVSVE